MLSINTNLSSLIAQQSMTGATDKLNEAIERMTTGFKINHASDNAANYSIATNMSTQINAYDVAADNVAMGMDLVNTASDIIHNMQNKASRLQALCTQARNGTYGATSLTAINSEASAIMAEITRLYQTAEYNGISLFDREAYELTAEHKALTESLKTNGTASAEHNGFIEDPKTYTDEEVAAMTRVKDVSSFSSGQKYAIYTKEELQKLAEYVNDGNSTSNVEFVLGADIDLSSISNWTPIGTDYNHRFKGTFDGNGHVIKNLTINNPTEDYQGLFGYSWGEIKNVGVENCNVTGYGSVGGLAGDTEGSITNSYATGSVSGDNRVGGLAGYAYGDITNSYATGSVSGTDKVGGLAGYSDGFITNSYATGSVTGTGNYVGGLAGYTGGSISNSYATGSVTGTDKVGGLVGYTCYDITNSYATGSVSGNRNVGGLAGTGYALRIENSYTTSTVQGDTRVGGIIGYANLGGDYLNMIDTSSYATVNSISDEAGAVVGFWESGDGTDLTISNCSTVSTDTIIGSYTDATDEQVVALGSNVSIIPTKPTQTTLQVGIYSDSSCQLNFDTNFKFDLSSLEGNIGSDEAYTTINDFVNLLSEKSTQLGAVQNRLDSALESIMVNLENLTSSRSTIRDADIAEVSSHYIQQQILQQASATLLATANQSPSIALQLI